MLHLFIDDRPWFRAKSRGYGTGLPIAWQGWLLLGLHIALITGVVLLLRDRPVILTAMAVLAAIAPLPLYRARTEGGWRWNWGGSSEEKRKPKDRRK
ncbi:hypothetical protein [Sphingopyxis sp. H115]|uniref:hypothetical protein n=1 Tax=Sphingopyxis sp. H115 TaxID=1759073 RepID=UPI000736D60B|nr:hypothetical protein [Sphingopyxis sp. H115]KTE02869.1 hypothetical protein ATE71_19905 [Sphingopyxis sp. H115]